MSKSAVTEPVQTTNALIDKKHGNLSQLNMRYEVTVCMH